ncbi:MAG: fumarylacetoacetate hydrolase family protein [Sodaliphilus sp.]
MKIIVVTHSEQGIGYHLIADSAMLTCNKPFFVPDFAPEFKMHAAIAVRIDRLGKTIAERFAPRYYQALAACAVVEAEGVEGNPFDARHTAFDGAFFLGEWLQKDTLHTEEGIKVEAAAGDNPADSSETITFTHINQVIAQASSFFTLKMGDILVLGADSAGHRLSIGEHISASICGAQSLTIRIK